MKTSKSSMCVVPSFSDDASTTVGSLRSEDGDSSDGTRWESEPECIIEDRKTILENCSIDCQVCNLALHVGGSHKKGVVHLVVTMQNVRVLTQYHIKRVQQSLETILQRLQNAGVKFVATYDLRRCVADPQIAQALAKLHRKFDEFLSFHLAAIALLVPDNLFTLASQGSRVLSFLMESCMPNCPQAILHSEVIAERFFAAYRESSSIPFFVSVAGVRSDSVHKPGTVETCVASLVPLKPAGPQIRADIDGVGHALPLATMMHTLENGDVRVIQSAATDVMIRANEVSSCVGNPQDGSDDAQECTDQTKKSKEPEMSPGELELVEALKFQGPEAKLKQFVGIHFHIGELTIDADAASSILKGPAKMCTVAKSRKPQRSTKSNDDKMRSGAFATGLLEGCLAGIALFCGH